MYHKSPYATEILMKRNIAKTHNDTAQDLIRISESNPGGDIAIWHEITIPD